jgi:DNA-binding LacI/PurR family transcriptional regulator
MGTKTDKTLEDIARLANVSKSTVSRALSDSPLINVETKERIRVIAKENDFCINSSARSLSTRQSNTIAFVTHASHDDFSVEDLFSIEILGGIGNSLHSFGYDLLIIHVNSHDTEWAHQYLDSGRVDGFILMKTGRKQSHIKALIDMGAPFILWGVPGPDLNCCSVTGDNLTGGILATEHLIRTGKKKIALIGGPTNDLEAEQRYRGYETAIQASGLPMDAKRMVCGDYSHTAGINGMRRLLEQAPDLDSVFVTGDVMAIGAISVILESGKRVPEDIAVVGYDDLSIAAFNNLPLTTVKQNIAMSGRLLAQNLVQYIKTGVVTNVTVPVELIVRKSA